MSPISPFRDEIKTLLGQFVEAVATLTVALRTSPGRWFPGELAGSRWERHRPG